MLSMAALTLLLGVPFAIGHGFGGLNQAVSAVAGAVSVLVMPALGLALSVHDDVVAAARELLVKIARNGPNAVSLAKRCLNETGHLGIEAGLAHEATLFGACFAHDEQTQGMSAFLEKRRPSFGDR
jgi:enoyl-CoA hydratase/carnithine racemase